MRTFFIVSFISLFSTFVYSSVPEHSKIIVPNEGQWEQNIHAQVNVGNATLFFTNQGLTFLLEDQENHELLHEWSSMTEEERLITRFRYFAYHMNFENASFEKPEYSHPSAASYHYIIGKDSSRYATHVKKYQTITYKDVYPDIDFRLFYTLEDGLKYEFLVQPGGDPKDISWTYDGLDCMLEHDGRLIGSAGFQDIEEHQPIIQQNDNTWSGNYLIREREEQKVYSFEVEDYDHSEVLVIDPVLVVSTASGSTANNFGHAAGYDFDGNIYSAGIAFSNSFPTTLNSFITTNPGGGNSMAIMKFNPDGTALLWCTYLGGSDADYPFSLVPNDDGEITVLGTSLSTDYPTTPNAYSTTNSGLADFVITRLDVNGANALASTYVGGSQSDGFVLALVGIPSHDGLKGDFFNEDTAVVFVGSSNSSDYPNLNVGASIDENLVNNLQGVVTRMSKDLSTMHASVVIDGLEADMAFGIKKVVNGDIYVTGNTNTPDLPLPTSAFQPSMLNTSLPQGGLPISGYVLRFSPDLNVRISGTYLSLNGVPNSFNTPTSGAYFVDSDADTNIFVATLNSFGSFPFTNLTYAYGSDSAGMIIHQLDQDLTQLNASAKLDTNEFSSPEYGAFEVDECSRVLYSVYGKQDLELVDTLVVNSAQFDKRLYCGVIEDMSSISFGTLYSGDHVDGGISRFDNNGVFYQAVCNDEADFVLTPGAAFTTNIADFDTKVFKIELELTQALVEIDPNAVGNVFCIGDTAYIFATQLTYDSTTSVEWYIDNVLVSTDDTLTYVFNTSGAFTLELVGLLNQGVVGSFCFSGNEDVEPISVLDFQPRFVADTLGCPGIEMSFENTNPILPPVFPGVTITSHDWDFGDSNTGSGPNTTHIYNSAGLYDVTYTVTFSNGCSFSFTEEDYILIEDIDLDFSVSDSILCAGQETTLAADIDGLAATGATVVGYTWEIGNALVLADDPVTFAMDEPGVYDVELLVELSNGCTYPLLKEDYLEVVDVPIALDFSSFGCTGDSMDFEAIFTIPEGIDDTQTQVEWQFGDFFSGDEETMQHVYSASGVYDITFIITTSEGCVYEREISQAVSIVEVEEVEVTLSPNAVDTFPWSPVVATAVPLFQGAPITGLTLDSVVWRANGEYIATTSGNTLDYISSTDFDEFDEEISAEVFYPFCSGIGSTSYKLVNFESLGIPNIFTPNGDGRNDGFIPSGRTLQLGPLKYVMSVYNRFGEEVFRTTDYKTPWYGTDKDGKECSAGVYAYTLYIYTNISKEVKLEGVVILDR